MGKSIWQLADEIVKNLRREEKLENAVLLARIDCPSDSELRVRRAEIISMSDDELDSECRVHAMVVIMARRQFEGCRDD